MSDEKEIPHVAVGQVAEGTVQPLVPLRDLLSVELASLRELQSRSDALVAPLAATVASTVEKSAVALATSVEQTRVSFDKRIDEANVTSALSSEMMRRDIDMRELNIRREIQLREEYNRREVELRSKFAETLRAEVQRNQERDDKAHEERHAKMNEVREQLNAQNGTFATRDMLALHTDALTKSLDIVNKTLAGSLGALEASFRAGMTAQSERSATIEKILAQGAGASQRTVYLFGIVLAVLMIIIPTILHFLPI